jgi:acyl carrier protein
MVPAAFVLLDALPVTVHGKVDRAALPAPAGGDDAAYIPPRGPVAEVLAQLWADLLGVERVGAADDFFELGGHSLLATQLVSRLRSHFGVELPVRAVFEERTVARLAVRLAAAAGGSTTGGPPPLVARSGDRGSAPLSFAQQRLWFLDRLEPGSAAYNMPLAVRLSGRLDRGALARSVAEVVRRHESLRTRFATGAAGEPFQVIDVPRGFVLPEGDLAGLADGGAGEVRRRWRACGRWRGRRGRRRSWWFSRRGRCCSAATRGRKTSRWAPSSRAVPGSSSRG